MTTEEARTWIEHKEDDAELGEVRDLCSVGDGEG
jgi:hypothetical protein